MRDSNLPRFDVNFERYEKLYSFFFNMNMCLVSLQQEILMINCKKNPKNQKKKPL